MLRPSLPKLLFQLNLELELSTTKYSPQLFKLYIVTEFENSKKKDDFKLESQNRVCFCAHALLSPQQVTTLVQVDVCASDSDCVLWLHHRASSETS